MKRTIGLILFLVISSAGCTLTKSSGSVKMQDEQNQPYFEMEKPFASIRFFGDYRFHPFKEKYFMSLDKGFANYVTKPLYNHPPKLMYAAHTVAPPYYSTVALLYNKMNPDDLMIQEIVKTLKHDLHAYNDSTSSISTNFGSALRIVYNATDPNTKISSCYSEYFLSDKNDLIRICFWTTDCQNNIINEETEGLIKKIKLEQP